MSLQKNFNALVDAATTIVFDFDGVLADSEKYHFITYSEAFARHGHTIDEVEYYKYWTSLGHGARGEIERHQLDLDPIQIRDEKRAVYSERCRDGSIKLFPEAKTFVDRFAAAGKELVIASGSMRPDIEAILRNGGIDYPFVDIVGVDRVPVTKPAPDVFLETLRSIGRKPSECLVIEDAEKGVAAAQTAGIPVMVILTDETKTFDFSHANLSVDSHAAFAELLTNRFASGDQHQQSRIDK